MKTLLLICLAGFGLCSMKSEGISKRDQKFAKEAAMASIREINMGKLAQSHSSNSAVKALGSKMVADHTQTSKELASLAKKKGLAIPKEMCKRDAKKYEKLSMLKGEEFDKEFAKYAKKNNKKTLKLYRCAAKRSKDNDFTTFAYENGFKLEKHVTKAEAVSDEVRK